MKKISLCLGIALAVLAMACKKEQPVSVSISEPLIPAVVLAGTYWQLNEQGLMQPELPATQGEYVLVYLNTDKDYPDTVAETRRGQANTSDQEQHDYIHVFSDSEHWVRAETLALGAKPAVLLNESPVSATEPESPEQLAKSETLIPANTIIAVHHSGILIDYLKVTYIANGAMQTGYILNPHPHFSTSADDAKAVLLYNQAQATENTEEKKLLLDSALALNLSPPLQKTIQAARTALEPPPKPKAKTNVSYETVQLPKLKGPLSKGRYSVNINELMSGGTSDPFNK